MPEIEELSDLVTGGAAETLVRLLFQFSGYRVYLFGRWKARNLENIYTYDNEDGTTNHPDLIMYKIGPPKGKRELIEVKYRVNAIGHPALADSLFAQAVRWHGEVLRVIVITPQHERPIRVFNPAPFEEISFEEAGWKLDQKVYEVCLGRIKKGL